MIVWIYFEGLLDGMICFGGNEAEVESPLMSCSCHNNQIRKKAEIRVWRKLLSSSERSRPWFSGSRKDGRMLWGVWIRSSVVFK